MFTIEKKLSLTKVDPTPLEMGDFFPPEWFQHEATWLSWPHKQDSWPGKFEPVPEVFVELIRFLAPHEKVKIITTGKTMEMEIKSLIEEAGIVKDILGNISYFNFQTNDAWIRDHLGSFVINTKTKKKSIVNWGYNALGEKYPPFDLDNAISSKIANHYDLQNFEPYMILEGGSIDTNGEGVLMTTASCLLNQNRNPKLSKEDIELKLKAFLGIQKTLWLERGIVGDDTDGHIDDIARFISPTTILAAVEQDPQDANYEVLQENLKRLKTFTDLKGEPFQIIELPMPDPIYYDSQRVPASYANFYIANNVVLVPTFRCNQDKVVLELLQKNFGSSRRVIGIDSSDLIWGLGAIHCVTHEEPQI